MVEGTQAHVNRITVATAEAQLSCQHGEPCYLYVAIGGICGSPPIKWRPPPTLSLEENEEGFIFRFQNENTDGLVPRAW